MTNTPSNEDDTATTSDLPEAFTQPAPEQPGKQVYDNDPTATDEATSSGLDRVDEGSAESFPGSDVPATMPPTTVPDQPVDPTA